MSTDLATINHNDVATTAPEFSIGAAVAEYANLAGQIAKTQFVPADFNGRPEVVLAAMLYGRELGLGPMQSLSLIQSIKGRVGLKPEGMRALVRQKGHRIWPTEMTDTSVTLCGWRLGDPTDAVVSVTWTMDDAKRAGLGAGDNWRKYPRAMLVARATSELCRLHFADVIGGLSYTPDELADFDDAPTFTQPPAPAIVGEPAAADVETGEIVVDAKPATTRRRPPPTRIAGERAVLAREWKMRLLAAVEDQGIGADAAKQVCGTFVESHPELADDEGRGVPLAESQVVALIAELTGAADGPGPAQEGGGDDLSAPF